MNSKINVWKNLPFFSSLSWKLIETNEPLLYINDEIAQKHQDLDITVTSSDPLHIFNIHPRYAR